MATRRANRPPPDSEPSRRRRRRLPWRRGGGETRGLRPGTDPAYEHSDAAEQERVIIEALEDLRDMDVREVMTPRLDIVSLRIPVSAEDVARAVRESGHSCFPVVNGGLDVVVGVLYVNDLFRSRRATRAELFGSGARDGGAQEELPLVNHGGGAQGGAEGRALGGAEGRALDVTQVEGRRAGGERPDARSAAGLSAIEISRRVRQPYVIPESRPILAALVEMRRHRRGFAVVVDEHGGVAGVLTVKDLLEPIVGDLHDELDEDEGPSIVRVDGSRWLVDGRTNVDEVRERFGIDVPEGDYVTIGGYLLDALGHIPVEGEAARVEGWELTVHDMDKRRIAAVLARRLEGNGEVAPAAPDVSGGGAGAAGERGGVDGGGGAPRSAPGTGAPVGDQGPGEGGAVARGGTNRLE